MAMVCDIDAFCKWFAPLDQPRLLQNGANPATTSSLFRPFGEPKWNCPTGTLSCAERSSRCFHTALVILRHIAHSRHGL